MHRSDVASALVSLGLGRLCLQPLYPAQLAAQRRASGSSGSSSSYSGSTAWLSYRLDDTILTSRPTWIDRSLSEQCNCLTERCPFRRSHALMGNDTVSGSARNLLSPVRSPSPTGFGAPAFSSPGSRPGSPAPGQLGMTSASAAPANPLSRHHHHNASSAVAAAAPTHFHLLLVPLNWVPPLCARVLSPVPTNDCYGKKLTAYTIQFGSGSGLFGLSSLHWYAVKRRRDFAALFALLQHACDRLSDGHLAARHHHRHHHHTHGLLGLSHHKPSGVSASAALMSPGLLCMHPSHALSAFKHTGKGYRLNHGYALSASAALATAPSASAAQDVQSATGDPRVQAASRSLQKPTHKQHNNQDGNGGPTRQHKRTPKPPSAAKKGSSSAAASTSAASAASSGSAAASSSAGVSSDVIALNSPLASLRHRLGAAASSLHNNHQHHLLSHHESGNSSSKATEGSTSLGDTAGADDIEFTVANPLAAVHQQKREGALMSAASSPFSSISDGVDDVSGSGGGDNEGGGLKGPPGYTLRLTASPVAGHAFDSPSSKTEHHHKGPATPVIAFAPAAGATGFFQTPSPAGLEGSKRHPLAVQLIAEDSDEDEDDDEALGGRGNADDGGGGESEFDDRPLLSRILPRALSGPSSGIPFAEARRLRCERFLQQVLSLPLAWEHPSVLEWLGLGKHAEQKGWEAVHTQHQQHVWLDKGGIIDGRTPTPAKPPRPPSSHKKKSQQQQQQIDAGVGREDSIHPTVRQNPLAVASSASDSGLRSPLLPKPPAQSKARCDSAAGSAASTLATPIRISPAFNANSGALEGVKSSSLSAEAMPVLPISRLLDYVLPGDVILFSCDNLPSRLQRGVTSCSFDHVGIVVDEHWREVLAADDRIGKAEVEAESEVVVKAANVISTHSDGNLDLSNIDATTTGTLVDDSSKQAASLSIVIQKPSEIGSSNTITGSNRNSSSVNLGILPGEMTPSKAAAKRAAVARFFGVSDDEASRAVASEIERAGQDDGAVVSSGNASGAVNATVAASEGATAASITGLHSGMRVSSSSVSLSSLAHQAVTSSPSGAVPVPTAAGASTGGDGASHTGPRRRRPSSMVSAAKPPAGVNVAARSDASSSSSGSAASADASTGGTTSASGRTRVDIPDVTLPAHKYSLQLLEATGEGVRVYKLVQRLAAYGNEYTHAIAIRRLLLPGEEEEEKDSDVSGSFGGGGGCDSPHCCVAHRPGSTGGLHQRAPPPHAQLAIGPSAAAHSLFSQGEHSSSKRNLLSAAASALSSSSPSPSTSASVATATGTVTARPTSLPRGGDSSSNDMAPLALFGAGSTTISSTSNPCTCSRTRRLRLALERRLATFMAEVQGLPYRLSPGKLLGRIPAHLAGGGGDNSGSGSDGAAAPPLDPSLALTQALASAVPVRPDYYCSELLAAAYQRMGILPLPSAAAAGVESALAASQPGSSSGRKPPAISPSSSSSSSSLTDPSAHWPNSWVSGGPVDRLLPPGCRLGPPVLLDTRSLPIGL